MGAVLAYAMIRYISSIIEVGESFISSRRFQLYLTSMVRQGAKGSHQADVLQYHTQTCNGTAVAACSSPTLILPSAYGCKLVMYSGLHLLFCIPEIPLHTSGKPFVPEQHKASGERGLRIWPIISCSIGIRCRWIIEKQTFWWIIYLMKKAKFSE